MFVASKHHDLVSKGGEIAEYLCCTRCPNGIEVDEDVVEDLLYQINELRPEMDAELRRKAYEQLSQSQ